MRRNKNSGSYIDYESSGSYEGSAGSSGLIKVETDPVKRSKLWLYILIALAVIFAGLFVYQKLYDAKRTKDSFAAAISDENYTATPSAEDLDVTDGVGHISGQLVVISKIGAKKADMVSVFTKHNLEIVGYVALCDMYQVKTEDLESEESLNDLIDALKAEEYVEEATLNYVYQVGGEDYLPVDKWDGYTLSDTLVEQGACWGVEAINAPWFWENFNLGTVRVGIIDNMFAWDHRDLKFGKLYCNDYSDNEDGYYHGTHVAGIIGATHNNGKEIAGVLEDAEIYGMGGYGERVDGGYDWVTSLISSVALLVADDAKVINYSVGYVIPVEYAHLLGIPQDELLEEYRQVSYIVGVALQRILDKGYDFMIVCSAGNEACDAQYASAFTGVAEPDVKNRIIVVGNAELLSNGEYALHESSNIGERVDVNAPGTDIYSTIHEVGLFHSWADYLTGTSMAAPFVTGEAAALWAFYPELNGAQIKTIVVKSADTDVTGSDKNLINMKTAFTKEFIDVSGITLDYSNRVLAVGESMRLTATIMPLSATDSNVKWYSTDKTVATVDQTGYVTALAKGETEIVARSTDGKTASCNLIVVPEVIEMQSGFVIYPKADCKIKYSVTGVEGESAYLYYVCQEDPDRSFSVFIKDSESVDLYIPKGSYQVFETFGQNWYGTEYRFGDGAPYSVIDQILDYTNEKFSYWLGLRVADGNLSSSPISESEFPD